MAKTITTSRTLIRNTLSNLVMLMSNAIIYFLLIRFYLGCFGPARNGVWVLVGSVFRYRMILGLGLNSAINRRIPMYLARDDEEGIRKVVSTALFFFSIMALVLVVLTVVLSVKIGDWFTIEPELVREARVLTLVVGLGFAASTPLQLTTAVLSGLQRYDMVSIVTVVVLTLRTILTVILLLRGYGLVTLGLIYGVSEVVARGTQHILARRLLPKGYISWRHVDRVLLKEMLFYGMNTFLYAIGALIIYRASETIVGIYLGTSQVSQLQVAAAGLLLLSEFVQAFTTAIKPAVSDLDTRDDQTRVKLIAFLTQKYSLLILIPAAAFLMIMGREFLTVWVAERFGDPAVLQSMATVLTILTAGYCLLLSQHSNYLVLSGRGEHRVFGILTAVEAVLCVSIAIYSVKVLGWGLEGIAWSNLLPMGLVAGVILPIYFNRKMEISAWDSIRQVWWPALLGTVPSVVLIGVWKHFAPPASWAELVGVVAAVSGTTALCGWFLGMDSVEHQRLLSVLRRGRRQPAVQTAEATTPVQ
jgi:O-antigen/teichoic acid export membrane protein